MPPLPALTLPTPTPAELDDLTYFCRTGDLASLRTAVAHLCTTHATPPSTLLASAIDIDIDPDASAIGAGSQSSLLHWPAANGHVAVLQYLLTLLRVPPAEPEHEPPCAAAADRSAATAALVNHRN